MESPSPLVGEGCGVGNAGASALRQLILDKTHDGPGYTLSRMMNHPYPTLLHQWEELPVGLTTHGDLRHGFVYERVPHITLKSIAGNADIDGIWEEWQETLEPLRADLNAALNQAWEEWETPGEAAKDWPKAPATAHAKW